MPSRGRAESLRGAGEALQRAGKALFGNAGQRLCTAVQSKPRRWHRRTQRGTGHRLVLNSRVVRGQSDVERAAVGQGQSAAELGFAWAKPCCAEQSDATRRHSSVLNC